MLMLEHMDHLSTTAAEAISNIKFDKVVVWDGGAQNADGGPGGAAGFVRNLAGALPPALEMMRDIGGVDMPEFFGRLRTEEPERDVPRPEATGDGEPATDGSGAAGEPPAAEAGNGHTDRGNA
jgi:flotillin